MAKGEHGHTSLLIGCLVGIILLLLAVIVLILWRHHWKRILGKVSGGNWEGLGGSGVNWEELGTHIPELLGELG
ncbi:hypothetical protein WISP_00247 [Willisornis vidua]|uniref:Uncharacterized protein n=1 Tax=Willisornis vidua TaxID=1566151 RepID=A0ABQ9CJH5_9PASS|nr:hypothetical protein WISP_00247 [Willisornis vidua]